MVFNTLIAFMLMELNVFQAPGDVLGLYSNIAIAWVMAVVADLVINKPLGLSPPGIEFKRAHLHDINSVAVCAMALASLLSVTAHLGLYGEMAQDADYCQRYSTQQCVICERAYEGPDMAHCPAYQGPICSRCCALDARCGDLCKPYASLSVLWSAALRWLLPRRIWP